MYGMRTLSLRGTGLDLERRDARNIRHMIRDKNEERKRDDERGRDVGEEIFGQIGTESDVDCY